MYPYDPNAPQPPQQPTWYPPTAPGQRWASPPPAYPQPQGQRWQQRPPQQPKKRRRIWLWIIGAIILLALYSAAHSSSNVSTTTPATTTAPTRQATAAQPIHYPPKTLADLRGLAAKGHANDVHEFHSESTGLVGACPQPKREVTVSPGITGQQFAEDLLAYFYAQQLDSPCGSLVLAYHSQSEANDVYTAGRINFDVTDATGQANADPNATDVKHTLTLGVGGLNANQEYVVTY